MTKSDLESRMKRYEHASAGYLTRRVPVIVRIDGKAFHTFTRKFNKPFDTCMMHAMQKTMVYLCENVQGCVFGYTQSDEITLILTDYKKVTTSAWFDYNIQKMTSVAASMATLAFNNFFNEELVAEQCCLFTEMPESSCEIAVERLNYLSEAIKKGACFDARVFSVPKDDVCNNLIWRQQDATRNSIEAAGRAFFSQREMHGKSCSEIQAMLFQERGVNWNSYPTAFKRGSCCYKVKKNMPIVTKDKKTEEMVVERNVWQLDKEMPILTQDREFLEKWL